MAATAAMPAPAMEMPNELAEPLKGVIGEVVGSGPETPDPDGAPVPTALIVTLLKTLDPAEEAGMAALFDVTGAAATVTVERMVVGIQVLIVMTETDGAAEVAGTAAFIEVGTAAGLLDGVAGIATTEELGVAGIATGDELGVEGIEGAAAEDTTGTVDGTEGGVMKLTVKVEVEVEVDKDTDTGATVGLDTA